MTRLGHHSFRLLLASVLLVLCYAFAYAQDPMAKWKPSVGDKFTYLFHYDYVMKQSGEIVTTDTINDTHVMLITATSYSFDSLRTSVVVSHDSLLHRGLNGDSYYWFYPAGITGGKYPQYPFAIQALVPSTHSVLSEFFFSNAIADTQWIFNGMRDSVIFAEDAKVTPERADNDLVGYSSLMHWFYRRNVDHVLTYNQEGNDMDEEHHESYTFLSFEHKDLSVQKQKNRSSIILNGVGIDVPTVSTVTTILDHLGRPIRSWQLSASDGPREITLNVADVASGLYFLRLSGDGIDEITRVAIVH